MIVVVTKRAQHNTYVLECSIPVMVTYCGPEEDVMALTIAAALGVDGFEPLPTEWGDEVGVLGVDGFDTAPFDTF